MADFVQDVAMLVSVAIFVTGTALLLGGLSW